MDIVQPTGPTTSTTVHIYTSAERTPKTLSPCLHTFCLKCLQGHLQEYRDCETFPCPTCRFPIPSPPGGADQLVNDFKILSLLELVPEKGKPVKECKTHKGKSIEFYCKPCKQPLCINCKLTRHQSHETEDMEEAVEHQRRRIQTLLNTVRKKMSVAKEEEDLANKAEIDGGKLKDKVKLGIKSRAQELHEAINEYETQLLKKLDNAHGTHKRKVQQMIQSLLEPYASLCQLKEVLEKLLEDGNDAEITKMSQQLEEKLKLIETPIAIPVPQLPLLKFEKPQQLAVEEIQKIFGKMSTRKKLAPFPCTCRQGHKCWQHAQLIATMHATEKISGLAVMETGNIIVVDHWNKQVKVISPDGQVVTDLFSSRGNGNNNEPWDAVCMEDGQIAVTYPVLDSVRVYDGHRAQNLPLRVKQPRGVTILRDDRLAVIDGRKNSVNIYRKDGELDFAIQKCDGKIQFESPQYVAANINNNIIVSDRRRNRIKIFDGQGRLKCHYSTDDPKLDPIGICTDGFGHIIIADSKNHRLHLLTMDGVFQTYLATEEDGLDTPQALCIDGAGNLIVGEFRGAIKIFKYLSDS